jgi:hypothetical protein
MKTPSIGGNTHFLTFIDGFSRKTWIYFLKHIFDALSFFFFSVVQITCGEEEWLLHQGSKN